MPYPVVPTVPTGTATVINEIADPTTPTQKMAVAANGSHTETLLAGTDFFGNLANGGSGTPVSITAGTTADTVVKASAGRLCKVLIVTAGSNAMQLYDNATGHTGTVIGCTAANLAAGNVVDFQMPAANGITVYGDTNNPACIVYFS